MKKIFTSLALVGLFVTSGCTPPPDLEGDNTIEVVTTIAPLYSLTKHLTQNTSTKVSNIVPAGTSVHNFQLKPSNAKNIASADLIVINGLELELFLEDAFENTSGEVVDTSQGINLIENKHDDHDDEHADEHDDHDDHDDHEDEHTDEHDGHDDHEDEHTDEHDDHDDHEDEHTDEHDGHDDHEDEHADEHGHHHGQYDPHIWLDPNNAVIQAETIAAKLIQKDPTRTKVYKDNLIELKKKLLELDNEIANTLNTLNIENYIVFHDAYGYFESHYGIAHSAAVEEFPGDEPSPQYVSELILVINNENVQAIFTEPQFSPKLVTALSKDYNLQVASLDPLGNSVAKDSYFDMMRNNVLAFEQVFGKK